MIDIEKIIIALHIITCLMLTGTVVLDIIRHKRGES
jgi:hypothetical protein